MTVKGQITVMTIQTANLTVYEIIPAAAPLTVILEISEIIFYDTTLRTAES